MAGNQQRNDRNNVTSKEQRQRNRQQLNQALHDDAIRFAKKPFHYEYHALNARV